jgi:hypothetical protein
LNISRKLLFLTLSVLLVIVFFVQASAEAKKKPGSDDFADTAIKMLEKIETQVNSQSIDYETKKEFIDMLELEIERTFFFIDELKERLKYFDQYFDMLESVKLKTSGLKDKLEGKFKAPAGGSGRISQGAAKQVTADQIYDLETYVNYSESKKMLEDIEKDVDQNKISQADKRTLVKNLGEQLVQLDIMLDETRDNKRKIEKNIIKMLEVKLRSKNLLDRFYKNMKQK